MRKLSILLICAAALTWQTSAAAQGNHSTVERETRFGKIVGIDDSAGTGTYAWKGVPFAKAPVGALRWKAPVDPDGWKAPRATQQFGNACVQYGRIYGPGSNNRYDLSRIGVDAPRERMTEGRLSVYWLPHLPRIALMKFVAHYLAGRVHAAPGFRSFRTLRMKVQSRKALHVGLDGELFEMATPIVITIVPQSLLVKVPRS